jgi:hypothetical protein
VSSSRWARRAAALGAACVAATGAAPAHGFELGFTDSVFLSPDPLARGAWLDRSRAVEADVVETGADWSAIAPGTRPAGFAPADPGSPGYSWANVDAAVRDASARGLSVMLQLSRAPRWAERKGRPRGADPGTWRPSARDFGAFARAAATRYSGTYAPPGQPALPRVRYWQIWGEPNLQTNLRPQWVKRSGRFRLASPRIFRSLLNAAYAAIHAVQRDAFVLTAGTAPYGDYRRGGSRLPPMQFWRSALCATGPKCRVRFDALAHDPYSIGAPRRRALNRDDVSVADMPKLARLLRSVGRRGTISPRRPELWVTEVSWDSRPPDPRGVPEARHARWLAESFYLFWQAGVRGVLWFQIKDAPPEPSFGASYQSGIFLASGTPKLAAQAFRFPLVVDRARRTIWGRAPRSGDVVIERRSASGWSRVTTTRAGRSRVFTTRRSIARGSRIRARIGAEVSLTWTVR